MKTALLILVVLMVFSLPTLAARITEDDLGLTYTEDVFQANWFCCENGSGDSPVAACVAVPGVLVLDSSANWDKYVSDEAKGVNDLQILRSVSLVKEVPTSEDCTDWNGIGKIYQIASAKIRTWWPVMFDPPGTKWTLTIRWRTPGPSPKYYVEKALFEVKVTPDSFRAAIALFETLPFGISEVPLVSEDIAAELVADVAAIEGFLATPGPQAILDAQEAYGELLNDIIDNCNPIPPSSPDKDYSGIAQDACYPVCCKLYLDAVALGLAWQIDTPAK